MATFLQLVNDLERESGTIHQGSRLATVVGAPGRQEKMVHWIAEAWRMIQMARSDWPWMRREFSSSLIIGQLRYTPTGLGIASFSRWAEPTSDFAPYTIYDPAVGKREEQPLDMIHWRMFKSIWTRGVHDAQRPINVSIDYEGRLCFGPKPDKAYAISGEYYRAPQTLALDADVPICPAEHHHAILWRAMMLMGDHDEAPAVVSTSSAKFQRAFRDLVDASMESVSL